MAASSSVYADTKHTKAVVLRHLSDEIVQAIQSVDVVANRCRRQKVISDEIYRSVLSQPIFQIKHTTLIEAVAAAVEENEASFEVFLEILEDHLQNQPQKAKSLIKKINYHLQEAIERANIDQSTHEASSSPVSPSSQYITAKQATQKENSKDSSVAELSEASDVPDNSIGTLNASNIPCIRRRAIRSSPTNVELNEPAEVAPVQAENVVPYSESHRERNRKEALCQAQEKRFAHYDKLQQEAKCCELMKEKEKLEEKLDEQSVGYNNVCKEKENFEKLLEDKVSEVERLTIERDQIVAGCHVELEGLKSKVANKERELHELKVKRQECETRMSEATISYDTEISRYEQEIKILKEQLAVSTNTAEKREKKILGLQGENQQLCCRVLELHDELTVCRRDVLEFKCNFWSLLIFAIVFRGMIEVILLLIFVVGIYLYMLS